MPRQWIALLAPLVALSLEGQEPVETLALAEPGPAGATLFEELDPGEAGVAGFVNDYSSPDLWTKRWHEYLHGAAGSGVAVGDLNGDGLPEIFAVSKDEESQLFLNEGGMRFRDITEAAGLIDSPHPATGSSMADVDNDGDLDLYLCYVGGPNQLWINDGSARFAEQASRWGVDVQGGSGLAAFADYDRDGDLDFYLQNNLLQVGASQEPQADLLFENRGGRFEDVTESAGIEGKANGHSATWWDHNDDGWPDIYIANDFRPNDKLYRNNGDGTFTDVISQIFPQAPYSSMGSDFGDINNDGLLDFWGTDMATSDREKHMHTSPTLVLSYAQAGPGEVYQYPKNTLLLQTSRSQFLDIAFMAGLARTDWTWAARLADFNNDGWLDAFVANGMLRKLHFKDMAASLQRIRRPNPISIFFRGREPLDERNLAFRNQGDLTFEETGRAWGLDKLGVSFGAATGDLDLDGDLDLVVNNYQKPLSIYRNGSESGHRVLIRLRGRESNAFGIGAKVIAHAGDLTQARHLYLSRGYLSSSEPAIHFGLGARERIDRLEIFWPSGGHQRIDGLVANRRYVIGERAIAEAENGRGEAASALFAEVDLQWPEEAERRESFFNEFKEQPLLPFGESRLGGRVALGDVDGDGRLDIAVSGSAGQAAAVFVSEERGRLERLGSFDLEDDFLYEDGALAWIDLEGDGDLDLLAASGGVEMSEGSSEYENRVYRNEGGELARDWDAAFSQEPVSTRTLAVGDFDGDGDPDVFAGGYSAPGKYPHAAASSLWRNEEGSLLRVDDNLAPGLAEVGRVADAAWADLDDDGDLDLALAREWDTPLIWLNEGGRLRADGGRLDLPGLWTSIVAEDFDGDGRMDLLAGNVGLNTEYAASQASPLRLWYSKSKDGEVKLIETRLIEGEDWPIQERWRLEESFPSRMRAIGTEGRYASMSLQEMFGAEELGAYAVKEVSELRSGIFWQESDGSFTFEALPSFAQAGRLMDAVAYEAGGEGRKAVIVSLQPEFPDPWSGDVAEGALGLLLPRGERGFEAALPGRSGLVVEGSPRGLAVGDVAGDGGEEVLVYLSDGYPKAWRLARER